eukprot:scaffold751_cov395-Prasinococcus_capsulatus_cf.AAC.7
MAGDPSARALTSALSPTCTSFRGPIPLEARSRLSWTVRQLNIRKRSYLILSWTYDSRRARERTSRFPSDVSVTSVVSCLGRLDWPSSWPSAFAWVCRGASSSAPTSGGILGSTYATRGGADCWDHCPPRSPKPPRHAVAAHHYRDGALWYAAAL